jgi:hypothetical protein
MLNIAMSPLQQVCAVDLSHNPSRFCFRSEFQAQQSAVLRKRLLRFTIGETVLPSPHREFSM